MTGHGSAAQRADRVVRPYKTAQEMHQKRRGNCRRAAGGGRSEAISRKCPDWRARQCHPVGWHDGGQDMGPALRDFCRWRCPHRPKTVDAKAISVPLHERAAEIDAESIRKHGINSQYPIAQGEISRFHHADMRKGFKNLGFCGVLWVLSFAEESKFHALGMTGYGGTDVPVPPPKISAKIP